MEPQELGINEEAVGRLEEFRRLDDRVLILLSNRQLLIPLAALDILESAHLRAGERISIVRTEDPDVPIRMRRLR